MNFKTIAFDIASTNNQIKLIFKSDLSLLFAREVSSKDLIHGVAEQINLEAKQQTVFIQDFEYRITKIDIYHDSLYIMQIINDFQLHDILTQLDQFSNKIPNGISIIRNFEVLYRNQFVIDLFQYSPEQLFINPWEQLDSRYRDIVYGLLTHENIIPQEIFVDINPDLPRWILISSKHSVIENEKYVFLSLTDITEQKNILLQQQKERTRIYHAFESINEIIIITNRNKEIIFFNEHARRMTGYTFEEVNHQKIDDMINLYYASGIRVNCFEDDYFESSEVELEAKSGLMFNISIKVSQIYDDINNNIGHVMTMNDIGDAKRREREILYLTYHDVLTGLYNRTFFEEQLKLLDSERKLPLSVIMGDVNGLKLTNDVFGHIEGDRLLKTISKVLKNTCRHDDIIARWGGDEFIVLMPNTNDQQTHLVMNRIISGIEKVYKNKEVTTIMPSLSLGYGTKNTMNDDIFDAIKIAESNMYKRKMLTTSSVYSSIISSMKNALYEKSSETEEHANRLYQNCKKVASHYNLDSTEENELELFAMLHDIGKIGISDEILNKKGPLTDEEWQEMYRHPEIGYRIANSSKELKGIAKYILSHHEKFDGTGYPRHLVGYEIPLLSRILSVSDAYDAMTNDRPYREKMTKQEAFAELRKGAGTQFDPDIVSLFIKDNQDETE